MRVLVLNAGSATLKAAVLEPPDRSVLFEWASDWSADATPADRERVVRTSIDALDRAGIAATTVHAVGYRVVHGGTSFTGPARLDDEAVASIEALADLAPLHNPIAVATIRAGRSALSHATHVAAFDTAFHSSLPEVTRRYPVPESWRTEWGIQRFGFHGLSVDWASRRAAELMERSVTDLQLVVAHLGGGCSVTAVDGGRSVDTSMGMTPLEGLMMGTRSGSIDPGIMIRLLRRGLRPSEVEWALERDSGLLGVGGTADVPRLLEAESEGDERATLAIGMFIHRAAAGIAAAATNLTALDAIVFTGGIGEHSSSIRSRICARLELLGVPIPADDHDAADDIDAVIASGVHRPAVLRIRTREDVVIAEAAARITRDRPC